MRKVDKIIKGDSVAVIINGDYGSGWYSWHGIERLLYDPHIVTVLEDATMDKFAAWEWVRAYAKARYPEQYFAADERLTVRWVPIGVKFRIAEYDGKESIVLQTDEQWLTA
jgi:hypothetical protein